MLDFMASESFQKVLTILPDIGIYGGIGIVILCALWKCYRPVLRNTAALGQARRQLEAAGKMEPSLADWTDPRFLGKAMEKDWRNFIQNAKLLHDHGQACDVEDYVHEDSVIFVPGNAAFADIVPGLCTSLGILGTFLGLSAGLNNLNMQEMERAITQIVSGLALAFNTSIVGLICAMGFNIGNKIIVGKARQALASFVESFYRHGTPRPADTANQLVSLQREQAHSMQEMSHRMGVELSERMEQAVKRALDPVAQSMDRFLEGTTRQQIEGVRHIVNQFVLSMEQALKTQLRDLGDALSETVRQQRAFRGDMDQLMQQMDQRANATAAAQETALKIVEHFDAYVEKLNYRTRQMESIQSGSTQLLANLHNASAEQAGYLSQLREHQEALERYLQEYSAWMRSLAESLTAHNQSQRETLATAAGEIREGAQLLQGSYGSFVENIQEGLAGALGMFDETMQEQTERLAQLLESASSIRRGAEEGKELRELSQTLQTLNILLSQQAQREVS